MCRPLFFFFFQSCKNDLHREAHYKKSRTNMNVKGLFLSQFGDKNALMILYSLQSIDIINLNNVYALGKIGKIFA